MSTLVATWHSSQAEPRVLVSLGRKAKPRRWRVSVWVQRGVEQISTTIVSESPVRLPDLLETTLESVRELEGELPGHDSSGFDIHQLRKRRHGSFR